MSTQSSEPVGWLLTPTEGDPRYREAVFDRWVSSGQRTDYAAVTFDPPLEPLETGVSHSIATAILAPRHEGVDLRAPTATWPIHVYVLTTPDELAGSSDVPPDALKIEFWGLLAGRLDRA